ncbi:MAG: chromate transporter [Bacteroidales bacterium]|jgi:chromate transporter|nr:chromate transporter [Bacteroidales bacterium]
MKIYVEIFTSFAKIGAFTIGGGYAMIPLIQKEVVERKGWLKDDEFIEFLAISQSAPGIMAINLSIFVGERLKGVKGSIAASLGTALPSFVMILVIAMFFQNYKDNDIVNRVFTGIRPAVVALIAVPFLTLSKSASLNRYTAIIPVLSIALIAFMGISPIWLILSSAILGLFYHFLSVKSSNNKKQ